MNSLKDSCPRPSLKEGFKLIKWLVLYPSNMVSMLSTRSAGLGLPRSSNILTIWWGGGGLGTKYGWTDLAPPENPAGTYGLELREPGLYLLLWVAGTLGQRDQFFTWELSLHNWRFFLGLPAGIDLWFETVYFFLSLSHTRGLHCDQGSTEGGRRWFSSSAALFINFEPATITTKRDVWKTEEMNYSPFSSIYFLKTF